MASCAMGTKTSVAGVVRMEIGNVFIYFFKYKRERANLCTIASHVNGHVIFFSRCSSLSFIDVPRLCKYDVEWRLH